MTPSPRPERLPASGNLEPWAVTAAVPSHQRITIDDGQVGGPALLDGAEVAVDAEEAGGHDGHRAQGLWIERCISRLEQWRGHRHRYDRTATSYLTGLHIAGTFLWSPDHQWAG